MKQKIVILGGNGYLGEKLGKYLSAKGIAVYSVVRRPTEQNWSCEVWLLDELEDKLRNNHIDWMINCIACYESGEVTAEDVLMANYVAPFCCFQLGISSGIRRYMTMDTGLSIDCNLYSRAKKQFADSIDWKFNEIFGQDGYLFWNIELQNFYGEDESNERFIPGAIERLLRNESLLLTPGEQIRDFVWIGDVLSNIERLLYIENVKGRVNVPLGSGEGVKVRDAIVYLKSIIGSKSELRFGAVEPRKVEPDCVADIEKMNMYGFEFKYTWEKGFLHIVNERKRMKGKE